MVSSDIVYVHMDLNHVVRVYILEEFLHWAVI